ncbi:MAG: lytic transglycosylase domain-containing protein [Candidatus Eremiobacteraeota bacterium]|nr:lytic transglycosylase domain-containing protein [Candidatus Eremiobacteraeota bacterium]
MSDGMTPMRDLAAVESRIAIVSQDSRSADSSANQQSVAAFEALVNSGLASAPAAYGYAPLPPVKLDALIAHAAAANGEDPALVKAIVANESSFNPAATSPVGAQGLMQLMPSTAAEVGVSDAYDPAQNIGGGTRYLAKLLQRFSGDVPQAIAAYNAGPEAVARHEMPAETAAYVRDVLSSYDLYRK